MMWALRGVGPEQRLIIVQNSNVTYTITHAHDCGERWHDGGYAVLVVRLLDNTTLQNLGFVYVQLL